MMYGATGGPVIFRFFFPHKVLLFLGENVLVSITWCSCPKGQRTKRYRTLQRSQFENPLLSGFEQEI